MLSSRPVALGMDSHVYPTKTPGRTRNRTENAVPMTVHGKGKESLMQTPFHGGKQGIQKAPMTSIAQGKQIVLATRPNVRILGDKTPFPNRSKAQKFETPAPQLSKLSGLSFLEPQSHLPHDKTPDSQLRPSSARKQDRVPRLSAGKSAFVTPMNNGKHWDVSDVSVVVPEAEVQEVLEDDYDEIEYMAPNTLHLASQPAVDIELPDYKEVGKALFSFAQTYKYDDSAIDDIDVLGDGIELPGWDMIPLQELESDDPFRQFDGKPLKFSTNSSSQPKAINKKSIPAVTKRSVAPSRPVPQHRTTHGLRIPKATAPVSAKPGSGSQLVPTKGGSSNASSTIRSRSAVPKTQTLVSKAAMIATKPDSQQVSTKGGPSNPLATVRSRSAPLKTQTLADKAGGITMRTTNPISKPPQGIPSHSTTSTTMHVRTTSGLSTTATRRPAVTSTSSTLVSRSKGATLGGKKEDADALLLVVELGIDLDDDFRFEV